jgi:5-methyltetrahydrofolate--homocysteine methyltransferase
MIGTVKGDMHDIGKNLVITMLRGVGYEVTDLGVNVPAAKFVQMVKECQPHILGLSALLTTTMPQMGLAIEALAAAGLREGVKVIVGGAPVNEKFARDIGADGYAHDAGQGVKLVGKLLADREKSC